MRERLKEGGRCVLIGGSNPGATDIGGQLARILRIDKGNCSQEGAGQQNGTRGKH